METPNHNPAHTLVAECAHQAPIASAADFSSPAAYRSALYVLHQFHSDQFFPNSSEPHAALVYEVFFKLARNSVRLFCENLKKSIFGEPHVVDALKMALSQGVRVDVVTRSRPEESDFLHLLVDYQKAGLASIHVLTIREHADLSFCVIDDEAFRWEHDNARTLALGNMHNPKTAKKLSKFFDEVLLKKHDLVAV